MLQCAGAMKTGNHKRDLDTGEVGTKPKLSDTRVQDISLAAGVLIARKKRAMFGENVEGRWRNIGHAAQAAVARLKRND